MWCTIYRTLISHRDFARILIQFFEHVFDYETTCAPFFFQQDIATEDGFFKNLLVIYRCYMKRVTDFFRRATRTYDMDQTRTRDWPDSLIIQ